LNERIGLAQFRLGTWKIVGVMKGVEKGRSSLVKEKENMIYILTKMKRDNRDRRNIFNDKLVRINEKKNH
jgi:hypothetical protein